MFERQREYEHNKDKKGGPPHFIKRHICRLDRKVQKLGGDSLGGA